MIVKTKYAQQKEAHDTAISDRYDELMRSPGAMATAAAEIVMQEFSISWTTVYSVRLRVSERRRRAAQQQQADSVNVQPAQS